MYRFKNILIPVDNIAVKAGDIKYADTITRLAQSKKAYFVHIAPSLELPEEIRQLYPELLEPVDEFAGKKLCEDVCDVFSGDGRVDVQANIVEGDPLDQLLSMVVRKDIDLIIIQPGEGGSGSFRDLPEKLARKAPCSVLIVPEGFQASTYSKILVPVDFSEESEHAVEVALAFAKAESLTSVTAVHVYRVPAGFHKSGKSYDEFADIMKQNAEKQFNTFKGKFDTGSIALEPVFLLNDSVVKGISEAMKSAAPDLVVMSTRGRASGASVIMSSYTEKIIKDSTVPVLAVKKKGAGLNFLKALLEI
ncbi:MAG TPA: universal stress protein [Spirochaetota bacterium]|nr:universal stress protein [Spirochaetota bacterium]